MIFTELFEGALVLEGGGMRGSYTAGVLDYLMDKELYFKNCYGVSAGACNCCNYLSKQRGRSYNINIKYAHDKRYAGFGNLFKTGNYFSKEFTMHEIPDKLLPYDYIEYRRTNANFYAVVTNMVTGKAEYLKVEDMKKQLDYVWASSSLPLISNPVIIDDKEYLDGGIADSIPVLKAIADGNEKIVVVLTRDMTYRKEPNSSMPIIKLKYRKYKKLIKAMEKRHIIYNRTLEKIEELEKQGKIFVIRPEKEITVGRLDTEPEKLKELYEAGYNDMKDKYEGLMQYLQEK